MVELWDWIVFTMKARWFSRVLGLRSENTRTLLGPSCLIKCRWCYVISQDTRWIPNESVRWSSPMKLPPVLSSSASLVSVILYGQSCLWKQSPFLNLWFSNPVYLFQTPSLVKREKSRIRFPSAFGRILVLWEGSAFSEDWETWNTRLCPGYSQRRYHLKIPEHSIVRNPVCTVLPKCS